MPIALDLISTFIKWALSNSQMSLFGVVCLSECKSYSDAQGNPSMTSVIVQYNEQSRRLEFKGTYTATDNTTINAVMFGILINGVPAMYTIVPVRQSVMAGKMYDIYLDVSFEITGVP